VAVAWKTPDPVSVSVATAGPSLPAFEDSRTPVVVTDRVTGPPSAATAVNVIVHVLSHARVAVLAVVVPVADPLGEGAVTAAVTST